MSFVEALSLWYRLKYINTWVHTTPVSLCPAVGFGDVCRGEEEKDIHPSNTRTNKDSTEGWYDVLGHGLGSERRDGMKGGERRVCQSGPQ